MQQARALLSDVKDYLKIEWQDEKADRVMTGIISRGMERMEEIAGAPLDFEPEALPRSLLLDYCRYANSQAMEMFEQNFRGSLLDLYLFAKLATPTEGAQA